MLVGRLYFVWNLYIVSPLDICNQIYDDDDDFDSSRWSSYQGKDLQSLCPYFANTWDWNLGSDKKALSLHSLERTEHTVVIWMCGLSICNFACVRAIETAARIGKNLLDILSEFEGFRWRIVLRVFQWRIVLRVFQSVWRLADVSDTRLDKNEDLALDIRDLTDIFPITIQYSFFSRKSYLKKVKLSDLQWRHQRFNVTRS